MRGTVGDMIRSMAVLLIPVLLFLAIFTDWNRQPTVQEIDWQPAAAQAAGEAPFNVLAPSAAPDGQWVANRVVWSSAQRPRAGAPGGNYWMVGYLDPNKTFISVNQGDLAPTQFVARFTRDGVGEGAVDIGGQQWQRYVSGDDRTRALVHFDQGVTTVVAGDTSYDQLRVLAKTLTPVPK